MAFAIVGMDCLLPGADDAEAWIARSRAGTPALSTVPDGRWPFDPRCALDPRPGAVDATPTLVGGFVTTPVHESVDGFPLADMDPLYAQVVRVCRRAAAEARLAPARTDLVLANLSLPSTGAVRAAAAPYVDALSAAGLDVPWLDDACAFDRWHSGLPATIAARALGLDGHVTALDAACASGLYAVRLACERLAAGLADAVIAAGVNRADSSFLFLGFSQLRALSTSGVPRPLDRRADGLVVGEGAAAVVIKRLADALRDGDRVHAVIRGGGLGNDGRAGSLLSPSASGQLRALTAAWKGAGLDPRTAGYVECHATGTRLGDQAERDALTALLDASGPQDAPTVLSSTKGIVGHTITVAGLAGLIRAVGAVRDGVLPATPSCEEPALGDSGRFQVLDAPREWDAPVRRAGVSAFGFGGTNAHVIVDALHDDVPALPAPVRTPTRLAVVGLAAHVGAAPDVVAFSEAASLIAPAPPEATRSLGDLPDGAWIDAVEIDAARFRIPPREAPRVLPQQLLMLSVAADALADAPDVDPARTASIVGMGIDLHVAEHVVRWAAGDRADADPVLADRADVVRDAVAAPLDAARVQGVLPNVVANRVASTFDLQGPSYTVSAGDASGLVAVDHARRLLATGEADAVVVGAADLPGQLGALSAARLLHPERAPAEGAVALVLVRLDDALAAGHPIHAILDEDGDGALLRADDHHATHGHGEAVDGGIALLRGVLAARAGEAVTVEAGGARVAVSPPPEVRPLTRPVRTAGHVVRVPHSGPPLRLPTRAWSGSWGGERVPVPLPRGGEVVDVVRFHDDGAPTPTPIPWATWIGLPAQEIEAPAPVRAPRHVPTPREAPRPAAALQAPRPPAPPRAPASLPDMTQTGHIHDSNGPTAAASAGWSALLGTSELAAALDRTQRAAADAHAAFLAGQDDAVRRLGAVATWADAIARGGPVPRDPFGPPRSADDAPAAPTFGAGAPPATRLGTPVATAAAPPPATRLGAPAATAAAAPPARLGARAATADAPSPATRLGAPAATAAAPSPARLGADAPPTNAAAPLAARTAAPTNGAAAPTLGASAASVGAAAPPAQTPFDPHAPVPRAFDLPALERFASGPLSSCLGPAYADLDAYEPRVRLPLHPLLLVSRVVDVEGTRGELGPSRIVTEYDLPEDAPWAHDGKPPPCVVVESGQADLFLVSYLGIDEVCRGERLYRLLDCDLTFHADRPPVGRTLRHDIRIKRFARLGDTTLFYFEYDCTCDGEPVLTMRDGCAGFFTPAELSRPHGADTSLSDVAPCAFTPPVRLEATSLDEDAVAALTDARYADAFGPSHAATSTLRLPPGDWGLLSRVPEVSTTGGPHGLGRVLAEQDLSDDDWFNACHFQGDPCMPGTLMFDGCHQALQVWLLAAGLAADHPNATFEPLTERPTRLRCRGQVAPGHRKLVYEVRVKEAGPDFAVADVILHVDGTPVVRAEDVGVRIVPQAGSDAPTVDEAHFVEFSVGSPTRAFGPAFARFEQARGPRIPGPPLQLLHRATRIDAEPLALAGGTGATVAYDVPADAWYFAASPDTAMSFAVLLEIGLQPCGWLTAWEGAALRVRGESYFRNLGGTVVQHAPVLPDTGTLTTRATLTRVSESAGMILTFFDFEVRAGDDVVFSGDTHFGYFSAQALAGQKGLPLPDAERARLADLRADAACDLDLSGWTGFAAPRADLRMIDRVVAADPRGGKAGLGFYTAERDVSDDDWFFTAHFHEDPVMPGSLGLEALTQLARWALVGDRDAGFVEPFAIGREAGWKYRGQVLRGVRRMRVDLEVVERTDDALICDGLVWADDLPIYAFDGFGVRWRPQAPTRSTPALPVRTPAAALLDTFTVDGDTGHGVLRLDPAAHPWLADHCPTAVIPAVPMAFAAEIAAEAATLLRPGARVVGLPELEAMKWIHTRGGPVDLLVVAVAHGETVAVTLAVHEDNPRFPNLSGPKAHMRAVVQLGDTWPAPPPAPAPLADAAPVDGSAAASYDDGTTFHGPVLRAMTDLGVRGPTGAEATLHTRPDGDLVSGGRFVLDPLLLDAATHPMMSGDLGVWGIDGGRLAYPVRADDVRFFGPRPEGAVRCRLDLVRADDRALVFDVVLSSDGGPWCAFRWTEAVLDGGPVFGAPAALRKPFVFDRAPADVHVGRAVDGGWEVRRSDLVEPLAGSLARLLCTDHERAALPDDDALTAHLAVKEAVRAHLRARLGRDVHPSRLQVLRLRDDRAVVTDAFDLTADELVRHLHPTRFDLVIESGEGRAVARIVARARAD